ncbi:hypothetical protein I545_2243 [Mycobacterium kansasii 662]|uniref:Uncharacterized protein n=2 Tax=Mycobacterium kansasii TaxID=1768 RepID=A0A1V3XGS4_MYCKA|nr:hypothetical protein I545_2243 [Mycobacterium kansasii 662]KEP40239.1 hypothetical protein MKSMC1_46590 [Mycobacterium kansasii]OOK78298.1 hypothetical protein BZL30_1959 [Mycobacterium kansasii]OOK80976.1 hypothetical protein BZL29_1992 [Mycobacterium kansasii]
MLTSVGPAGTVAFIPSASAAAAALTSASASRRSLPPRCGDSADCRRRRPVYVDVDADDARHASSLTLSKHPPADVPTLVITEVRFLGELVDGALRVEP